MNGVISGTPTTAGNFNVTISATNSGGTGSATLALTVAQQQAPAITSSLSASGTVGVAFNYQITASNNPTSFNTTYIASYHTNRGKYSADENFFVAAYTNGPLTARSSASSGGNGVYAYSSSNVLLQAFTHLRDPGGFERKPLVLGAAG